MLHEWLEAFHVVTIIVWCGGIVGLASVTVLTGAKLFELAGSVAIRSLHRWNQRVTLPTTLLVWLSGAGMALSDGSLSRHWVTAKMALVLVLTAIHAVMSADLRNLVIGQPPVGLAKHRGFAVWIFGLVAMIVFLTFLQF